MILRPSQFTSELSLCTADVLGVGILLDSVFILLEFIPLQSISHV